MRLDVTWNKDSLPYGLDKTVVWEEASTPMVNLLEMIHGSVAQALLLLNSMDVFPLK